MGWEEAQPCWAGRLPLPEARLLEGQGAPLEAPGRHAQETDADSDRRPDNVPGCRFSEPRIQGSLGAGWGPWCLPAPKF